MLSINVLDMGNEYMSVILFSVLKKKPIVFSMQIIRLKKRKGGQCAWSMVQERENGRDEVGEAEKGQIA